MNNLAPTEKKYQPQMSVIIDRLPEENDRQYLAYTCYRDLGLSRSMLAAQRLYDQKMGKVADGREKKKHSGSLDAWAKTHHWEERAKSWDSIAEEHRRTMLMEQDKKRYLDGVERVRQQLEDVGTLSLTNSLASLTLVFTQLELLRDSIPKDAPMSSEQLGMLVGLSKCASLAVASLSVAREVLYDAFGLVELLREFKP